MLWLCAAKGDVRTACKWAGTFLYMCELYVQLHGHLCYCVNCVIKHIFNLLPLFSCLSLAVAEGPGATDCLIKHLTVPLGPPLALFQPALIKFKKLSFSHAHILAPDQTIYIA